MDREGAQGSIHVPALAKAQYPRPNSDLEDGLEKSQMDDISFVTGVLASLLAGLVLWWAFGRYRDSRFKKGLAIFGAMILGYVLYLALGTTFAIIAAVLHPERARETGEVLGHGFKTLPLMLMIVAISVLSLRGWSNPN